MAKRLDWERAKAKPPRVLSWKEQRLDRAADNWLDHGSLNNQPAPSMANNEPLDEDSIAALALLKAGPVARDGYCKIPYDVATLLVSRRLIETSHVAYHGTIATTRQRVYQITPAGLAALART